MNIFNQDTDKGKHVSGIDRGNVVMYGLSTCVWCKKTKKLLIDLGVDFEYVYVDRLEEEDENEAVEKLRLFNPSVSFPTTIINDEKAIVGFKEKQIREALGF
ncbi:MULTISPECIES: glutaredoxin family protein [unclassified Methanosarcina]|uniref:glutaredoxin family protein n=1 Tax=unclassified Methanosarcina TaxID=2644672 RepID=UPI000615DF8E|nr:MULTISPECIES: glutaredoxin family protein [unclassified Methanosarcina]AKB18393.1 glutaredoxin family protein [Methanosarcina sp. WWM596]AKB22060.1 glutaredoxin family protein [Methanosarcina sp. WH1]